MPRPALDPSPRRYAPSVSLLRRSHGAPRTEAVDADAIEAWLLGEAGRESDPMCLFEELAWRLASSELEIERASLHVGTLHPQAIGFAWNWAKADGLCDEVRVSPDTLHTDAYRRSPLFRVIAHGERFQADPRDPALVETYPFLAELAGLGLTEYLAAPLGTPGLHNAATFGTARPGGFTPAVLARLDRLLPLVALHVGRHIALRISTNIVEAYLGAAAGRQVLDGSIRRGEGQAIESVIWASDLRGFTDLSERLEPADLLAVLNAYFACMAGAVIAAGGEVLKFIGDGMLAAFPVEALGGRAAAAAAALAAARGSLGALDALNAGPPEGLADVAGWAPLRTGIGLHAGRVFFGNIGAPERLDFTVIGRAVNVASRVEGLCRPLGRPILLTSLLADYIDEPLDDLGSHALKGVGEPIRVMGLPEHRPG